MRSKYSLFAATCLWCLVNSFSFATNLANQNAFSIYDIYQWGTLYYYGVTANEPLTRIPFNLGQLRRWPENAQSIELTYTLDPQNPFRRFLSPLRSLVQLAGNVTMRQGKDESTIYEFDPYVCLRWTNFRWDTILTTSFAIGEGLSYTTSVPAIEKKSNPNTKHLLNYLMLETTLALPHFPRLQLVLRIHHRSGAFGIYQAGNTGSNNVGLGLRYLF